MECVGSPQWAKDVGWLDSMPRLTVRSATDPDSFDDESAFEVPDGQELVLPSVDRTELDAGYPTVEAHQTVTLFAPENGALFIGDLIYDCVHPGHGPAGDNVLFNRMRIYLADFLVAAVATEIDAAMTDRLTSL